MVRIKWLGVAKSDLKEIFDYISSDSKSYAKVQVERILVKIEALKAHTRMGKVNQDLKRKDTREIIEGNYRIIYKIITYNEIHILMIHHGARSLSKRI